MSKASSEDRGTVAELAALSHDLDQAHRDGVAIIKIPDDTLTLN
jgi:hypothetical protein